jgi:hypothetical protein
MPPLDVVVIATCPLSAIYSRLLLEPVFVPEPTPPITNDLTLLMVGNALTEVIMATSCDAEFEKSRQSSWAMTEKPLGGSES